MSVPTLASQSQIPQNQQSVIETEGEFCMGTSSVKPRSLSRYYKSKSRSFSDFSTISSQFGESAQALGKKRNKSVEEGDWFNESGSLNQRKSPNKAMHDSTSILEETTMIFHDLRLDQKSVSKRRVRRKFNDLLPLAEA